MQSRKDQKRKLPFILRNLRRRTASRVFDGQTPTGGRTGRKRAENAKEDHPQAQGVMRHVATHYHSA